MERSDCRWCSTISFGSRDAALSGNILEDRACKKYQKLCIAPVGHRNAWLVFLTVVCRWLGLLVGDVACEIRLDRFFTELAIVKESILLYGTDRFFACVFFLPVAVSSLEESYLLDRRKKGKGAYPDLGRYSVPDE